MKPKASCFATLAVFSLFLLGASPERHKSDVQVTGADPDSTTPNTVDLDVTIAGRGFKKGAIAKFYVSGTLSPGGITVNSTTFVDSHHLIANINVANSAPKTKFDISVFLINGGSGKGTQLFSVAAPDRAIAFTSSRADMLVKMNANGTDELTLLDAPKGVPVYRPDWSPDGAQLVFESTIDGDGIYVVNKDGTGLRKVMDLNKGGGFARPVWSPWRTPDGDWKIAFSDQVAGEAENNLFLVNPDGTGLINLTNESSSSQYWPTWNPSATRIAASVYPCEPITTCTPRLYVYDLGLVDGSVGITGTTDLTALGGKLGDLAVREPEWARRHDEIAFQGSQLTNTNNTALWVVSLADPTNPVELTATLNTGAASPSWAPDDSKIVFSEAGKNKHKTQISVISGNGTLVPRLAEGSNPEWRRCCPTCAVHCVP